MTHVAVVGAWRTRAIFVATALLLIGMVTVSFFGTRVTTFLSGSVRVHEPRPVLNVLISMVDGEMMYTINGARAFTFKEDVAFSAPKGENDYMKAYPLEGSTLVCQAPATQFLASPALTAPQVSNAHINGTFTHVVDGIGLPLYTQIDPNPEFNVLYALTELYDTAFASTRVHEYSSRLPALGSSWIYLPFQNGTKPFDASPNVAVYDVDLRDVTSEQISALKDAGSVVICRVMAGSALEHHPGSSHVSVGGKLLPKSATVGAVPGKSGEHFLNVDLPSVKDAVDSLIKRAAVAGCDGVEYIRTQFTAYQQATAVEPEQLAYYQWLTLKARSHKLFSVLRNEGSLTASYGLSYDVLVQQNNKPVFNVEDVEKYGFGAIPECSGRISQMFTCVQSILSKVSALEGSHRNICEKSRDLFVSTIFRALSASGNPEVMTCSPSLMTASSSSSSEDISSHSAASVKSLVPSRNLHDGMGGVQGSGWYSAASLFHVNAFLALAVVLASVALSA